MMLNTKVEYIEYGISVLLIYIFFYKNDFVDFWISKIKDLLAGNVALCIYL